MTDESQEAKTKLSTVNVPATSAGKLDAAWIHHNSWLLRNGKEKLAKWEFAEILIDTGIGALESTQTAVS
jgi:hypothetical protein